MNISTRPDEAGYYSAAAADEVRADKMTRVKIKGRKIILTRVDGRLQAVDARCPHGGADLGQGSLYRGRIDCPDHGYRFDLRTGRTLWPPDELYCLKRYPVKEEDGLIKIKLS